MKRIFQPPASYWWPPALWAALIFTLSSSSNPGAGLPWLFEHEDKVAHMLIFAVLAMLLYRALRRAPGWTPGKAALAALLAASLYGILDELHQSLVPERSVELADWMADTAGAALAVLILFTRTGGITREVSS